jgi:hypothetical protein
MDVERNYFELKHKIEFEVDQIPTAIIKFYFINQYTPTFRSVQLKSCANVSDFALFFTLIELLKFVKISRLFIFIS